MMVLLNCGYKKAVDCFQVGDIPSVYHFVHVLSPSRMRRSLDNPHPMLFRLQSERQVQVTKLFLAVLYYFFVRLDMLSIKLLRRGTNVVKHLVIPLPQIHTGISSGTW